MRGEILINAFANDIAVIENGEVLHVKGDAPPSTVLGKTLGLPHAIMFRL